MTDREKLLDTLKVAYEPRKIPQEDGSVAIHYPTDEDVADMIEAAIIDEYKHRIEVVERALDKACEDIKQLMDCCRCAYNVAEQLSKHNRGEEMNTREEQISEAEARLKELNGEER